MILATSYFPPIWYLEKLISGDSVIIEDQEYFVKQTIRNRCHILSPNGIQTLIVPVTHQKRYRTPMKDVRIANEMPWQRQHWRSFTSAYQRSAFFEFYEDELLPLYEQKFDFLLDFNMKVLQFLLDQLHIQKQISHTDKYEEPDAKSHGDFRMMCNTGLPMSPTEVITYPQVFGYKEGFVAGLSAADLLFNVGPASLKYIGKF